MLLMSLQGLLANVRPDLLRAQPHPNIHLQTPQWRWLVQQCLQRAGLLFNDWHCGFSFWAPHRAGPQKRSKFSQLSSREFCQYVLIEKLHCCLALFVFFTRVIKKSFMLCQSIQCQYYFSHRFSGGPADWWWQETRSSFSPSLAFLSCLEAEMILAGNSGRGGLQTVYRKNKRWTDGLMNSEK